MFRILIQGWGQRSERRSTQFSCTSLKDIQDLLSQDSSLEPYSPRRKILHQPRNPRFQGYLSRSDFLPPTLFSAVDIPDADNRDVVIYLTSPRSVQKIFEECRTVKSVLRGFEILIDERDLSMDSRFRDELKTIFGTNKVRLPKVFIGGKYIFRRGGGIKQLQERGELKKIISTLPPQAQKKRHRKQAKESCSCGFYLDDDDDVFPPHFGISESSLNGDHMGKIGLHCYNIENGTNLQFKRLLKCFESETDFEDFYLTLEAMDPVHNSVHTFETHVWCVMWEVGADLILRTNMCRI